MAEFVVDASATLPWCFGDEVTADSNALLERLRASGSAIVPAHWLVEVGNGLLVAIRKGRIALTDAILFLKSLESLEIAIESSSLHVLHTRIMPLSIQESLTLYDAAYLELAQRMGLPLATRDSALIRAANKTGVALLLHS